jgi:hypothetical protein
MSPVDKVGPIGRSGSPEHFGDVLGYRVLANMQPECDLFVGASLRHKLKNAQLPIR